MSELAVQENEVAVQESRGPMELLVALEREGKADEVSLRLTDVKMSYQTWESVGRLLGGVDRRVRWYIGDWLNFGESIFGDDSAQAVEATQKERYNEAERVTGLEHGTLLNIRSICEKIPRRNRSKYLGFWIHAEVAPLPIDQQKGWLKQARDNGWTRAELRQAIKDEQNPAIGVLETGDPGDLGGEHLTISERIEAAARLVYHQAQTTPEGIVVPPEPWAQLAAALGEGA